MYRLSTGLKCFKTKLLSRHLNHRLIDRTLINNRHSMNVLVYKGKGMFEEDTTLVYKLMKKLVDSSNYQVDTVSATDIIDGILGDCTALLVIGGGYDLGLIEALGSRGMKNIQDYVENGGSYFGICSGAYFACDYIEFDKGGPIEVLGERFLKFYPGGGIGPLFKAYDYKSRAGASAVTVDFTCEPGTRDQCTTDKDSSRNQDVSVEFESDESRMSVLESQKNNKESRKQYAESQREFCCSKYTPNDLTTDKYGIANSNTYMNKTDIEMLSFSCKVYFNGGGLFRANNSCNNNNVTVLSRYLDLPDAPAAIVQCKVGKGVAVLSGPHFEYNAHDIDDGDMTVTDIIPCLRDSYEQRMLMLKSVLQILKVTTN